jgi:hypothetical protein
MNISFDSVEQVDLWTPLGQNRLLTLEKKPLAAAAAPSDARIRAVSRSLTQKPFFKTTYCIQVHFGIQVHMTAGSIDIRLCVFRTRILARSSLLSLLSLIDSSLRQFFRADGLTSPANY